MDKYRKYDVKIRAEDQAKADAIIYKHWMMGDIDAHTEYDGEDDDGNKLVIYQISPFIYEDLETMINEFKQEGIRVL